MSSLAKIDYISNELNIDILPVIMVEFYTMQCFLRGTRFLVEKQNAL